MPLSRVQINNYKSIKHADILLSSLNTFIGENGAGKSNVLNGIKYFYDNLTELNEESDIFDVNNLYSNEVRIALTFDFSEIISIIRSKVPNELSESQKQYYQGILDLGSVSGQQITIELRQIKMRKIQWNCSYSTRQIIKSVFPLYYVDARNLDINEWDYVWELLGELNKVSNDDSSIIKNAIIDVINNQQKGIYQRMEGTKRVLQQSGIDTFQSTPKDFAKSLSKVYFSGEIFKQNDKQLSYYSAGTNAENYIKLIISIVAEIAKQKLKEPIIILDEPEIGLHTTYIDELANGIVSSHDSMCIAISTHSSRLIKDLLIRNSETNIFSVKLLNKYTCIDKLRRFTQYSPESKYRVLDDYINSYFAKRILFVEGDTELELFANPYLRLLFPKLQNTDVYKAMSETPILNIMNPKLTRISTPYTILVDMDKIIQFDLDHYRFILKNEFFSNKNKEKYMYYNSKSTEAYPYYQYKRIKAMAEKLHIHIHRPYFNTADYNYRALLDVIKEYLIKYHVYAFETTVEGALITSETKYYALKLIKKKHASSYSDFISFLTTLSDEDQLNILRFIFNGKSDLLFKYDTVAKNLDSNTKNLINNNTIGKKTSGWVSEFLDDYFHSIIKSDLNHNSFAKYLNNSKQREQMESSFSHSFPELYKLISVM